MAEGGRLVVTGPDRGTERELTGTHVSIGTSSKMQSG